MRHAAPIPGDSLHVDLLGRLEARTSSGREVPLSGRHAQALFALLVLARRPRSRDAIAADLWPESDPSSTGALRQALWLVRHGLGLAGVDPSAILDIRPDTLGLRPDAIAALDVTAFEACLDEPGCPCETAVNLYRGDLVEGLGHECFAAERERLADRFEDALVVVAQARLAAGDLDGASAAAQRLLVRDPLREEGHAILIEVYGRSGSRSQVIRQYRRLAAILERELGETPLPESDATYRLALERAVARSRERAASIGPGPDVAGLDRPHLLALANG